MLKELIICIVIVVSIISLDVNTQNFTKETGSFSRENRLQQISR